MDKQKSADAVGAGVFFIGLGLLFFLKMNFWPGILLVFAASGAVSNLVKGEWVDALVTVFIFGGLAAWFGGYLNIEAKLAIPLGLIGVGLIMLLNVFRRVESGKHKRKNEELEESF
jgi:hypothetical protein